MPRDGIRYGVQIACAAMHWPECLEITQAAEELGYASVWVPDHYTATPDGLTPDIHLPLLDGWTSLAALAQATRSVRLGPLVASATFRNPGVLAKLAATVDHVSGGRLELGLGAGWFEFEHSSLGIPFPAIGTRLRQLEETIRILRALWSQDAVDFEGEFFQLRGAVSEPKPLQKPMPPFVIGAQGEKVGLRNVARYADHWNTYCPAAAYPGKVAALRRHCQAENRDFGAIQRSVMMPLYLEEDELVGKKLASWGRMVRAQGDAVRDWFLVGSEAEIRARIDRFVAEGMDTLIVQVDRRSGNARTLERFAKTFMG